MKLPLQLPVALLLATVALQASAGPAIPRAGINVSADNIKKTAQFRNWKVSLDSVNKVGQASYGLFCNGTVDMPYTKNFDTFLVGRVAKELKEQAMALGYPKFDGGDSAFADKANAEPDFRIGLSLVALNYDTCISGKEYSGKASMTLKAELYSNKLQKVIYSRKIEGRFASDEKIREDIFADSLAANTLGQMFMDPKYVAAFRDEAGLPSGPGELITVKNGGKPKESVRKNAKDLLNAVVTIETAKGVGSGFYVGREGYVVTNYHVVGEAKFVKVKLAGGFAVPGEVLRTDPARDVALIKTAIEPPVPLFVRATATKVGEEVFAIGSPFGEQLSGTLTRGILSAERTVNEQKYLQSDASINPGNSGGPLVDADGALIAVADLKRENAAGIALFIPIAEVFDKLGLSLQ